uniref:Reverse transcriptase domain-containing protein n=1 Tax=Chenopodium quinoa TaxID=63459 RepID=A0A803NES3_CHEQI
MGVARQIHPVVIQEGHVLTDLQRIALCRPFTEENVKGAVWSIDDDKAPWPDGYTSKFFKESWNTIKKDVCEVVLSFFEHGKLLKQINNTFLTLIPKVAHANVVTQFRPIACFNVIYKILSKMICDRIKEILPVLISEEQGAFVSGRSILDNIMICHDLVKDYLNLRKPSRRSDVILTGDRKSISLCSRALKTFALVSGLQENDEKTVIMFGNVQAHVKESILQYSGFSEDDLMLFAHGDRNSVAYLCRALTIFWKVSRLRANSDKTAIYFGNVKDETNLSILSFCGFVDGSTPFSLVAVGCCNCVWLCSVSELMVLGAIVARIIAY